MFVTKVAGTIGSRAIGDIFIAAHTNDTTQAYAPLAQYAPADLTASCFTTASIVDGYYLLSAAEINTAEERVLNQGVQHEPT